MTRKRSRVVGDICEDKGGGNPSKKLRECEVASDTVDQLWLNDSDEGGVRGGRHGGGDEAYSSSRSVEGFINGLKLCGKPILMGEEKVKDSTRKLLAYLCEFLEEKKVEGASNGVLKALPGLLAWAKEVCLFVRGGGASTRGGGMPEDPPKNQRSPSSSPRPLKEENIRYFEEDDTKYRYEVLTTSLSFAMLCLEMMIMAPEQSTCKEDSGSGMTVSSSLSLRTWDGLQAVVVMEAATGFAATPPQLNWHLQWVRGGGGGRSCTTISSKQLKRQLLDYNELDFWKMTHFEIEDDEIHLPDDMVHELQSVAADYFVTAAQQHHQSSSLRSPRSPLPLTPVVSSPLSPSCVGSGVGSGGASKSVHGVHSHLCVSNAVGARMMRWACRICEIVLVILKEERIQSKVETAPGGSGGGGGGGSGSMARDRPLLLLSAVRRVLFAVRKGTEAAKFHREGMAIPQADKLEVWKLSTELMDALLTATGGLIQSVEVRVHRTPAYPSKLDGDTSSPNVKPPPSTLSGLCMALSRTLNVVEGGSAVIIESVVPEALDDVKFLAVSHECSAIRAGEQRDALSVYCAAQIIACLPGRGAFEYLLKRLGLKPPTCKTAGGRGLTSQAQEVKVEDKYMPHAIFDGKLLITALRSVHDLLRIMLQGCVERGGDMCMSDVPECGLVDTMSRAGRKCFLASPAKRLDLFLEEFVYSLEERGRGRANWCCSGSYSTSHFDNGCKGVMAVPRAVADRLILTLVASMVSERMAHEAMPRRGAGICFGHVSSPPSSATQKPWPSGGGISVVRQIISILHFLLKATAGKAGQVISSSTGGQYKVVEDGEQPSSTARPHNAKRIHLIEDLKLAADEGEEDGNSPRGEGTVESRDEGTIVPPPTYHPLVVNQTKNQQFALLFTAALEEEHFSAMSIALQAYLHMTPLFNLSPYLHRIASPTSGRTSSRPLSWIRTSWVAWEGLLRHLGDCCTIRWEPQMFQFLNGNVDAACLVQNLLQKLPFRAMAGTLRSSSGSHAVAAASSGESVHQCLSSSASSPFILPISDIALLRKCMGGVLAAKAREGEGSAQMEGIFPSPLLVSPWDCLLEHCTSRVKRGRGFEGCVSILYAQLLKSCYIAMEDKERRDVATRAFSACLMLVKELSDLQSGGTSGDNDNSKMVVEFEDVALNTTRPLPSAANDGLNHVPNSQGRISTLLGHVLFLLCFACDKLTDESTTEAAALQSDGEGGKEDNTPTASRLAVYLSQMPSLRRLAGNSVSGEAPSSCHCVVNLIDEAVCCVNDAIERPPRPWGRTGHAGKVCLMNVVDVHEMREQLLNVLSSGVIVAQPPPFHNPDLPVASNAVSEVAAADKRCIEGCFLFFAAWKLLAYLPGENLISLPDGTQNRSTLQAITATCMEEGHPEPTTAPMTALRLVSYARSVLMLLPAPESESSFSSYEHGGGRNDKAAARSQVGSPYFDGLLRSVSAIDLREISDKFQARLRWLVVEAELEEFPNGILCDDNLTVGRQEAGGGVQENGEEEDIDQAIIDSSSSSCDLKNEGDEAGGGYPRTWQNWEQQPSWEQKYHEWIRVKDGKGRENDVNTKATAVSQRREAHASLQAVGVCVQAVCASAQSEALEMREAGLSFSPEHTNSVTTALACWTSLFERCLEHFLFILKGCLMELYMMDKDWHSKPDVKAAEEAIEVLMFVEWPDIKEAARLLGLPVEDLEILRNTITAPPPPRVQLGSDLQRSLALGTVSSSAHSSTSSAACMEPERVALSRGSASQCTWEYVLNICIATTLFPGAGTIRPPPTPSQQQKERKNTPSLPSATFIAILEECTSVKNTLLEVFDGLLALLSLVQVVVTGNDEPNELSVDLADAIRLANESLAHPWLSSLRVGWMNAIMAMQDGDEHLAVDVADAWKIHSASRVLSSLVQQPTRWGGKGAVAASHAIHLLRTLVRIKGPRTLQEYYLSGIETPAGICRRPQRWEYELLDMFSMEVSDAVPSLIPNPDACELICFIAAVPECSKEALDLLKDLVCRDDGLEKEEEWDYDDEWPMLITLLVDHLLVSWTEDELRCVLAAQLDDQNQKIQQDKQQQQTSLELQLQYEKSSGAKDIVAILGSLLGKRDDDGLVKEDKAGERIERGVESDDGRLPSAPPSSELIETEKDVDNVTGSATSLAFDEESEKIGNRTAAAAAASTALTAEEIRWRRRKRRRSVSGHPLHHGSSVASSFRPMRIARKSPFKDRNEKGGIFKTKPPGSHAIRGRSELRHRVFDILIQLAHIWIPYEETHCSNGISDLVVWLASKCDKLPRLLAVAVEVGLKFANYAEDTVFPIEKQQQQQRLESTSYSCTVRLRSILKCLSLAKHLLDPLSHLDKMNKWSGSDKEALELKSTLDDLELVPQLCHYSDGVTQSFQAKRATKGMASESANAAAAAAARRDNKVPIIESEKEKRICTYVESSGDFVEQHWYNCFTCGLVGEKGCCSVCVKVCHAGHSVSYSRFSSYFCDCGAGEGTHEEPRVGGGSMPFNPCKCLKPLIPEGQQTKKKGDWSLNSSGETYQVTSRQTTNKKKDKSARSTPAALREISSSGGGINPQCGQLEEDLQGRQHLQQKQSSVAVQPAVWSKASQRMLYVDLQWLKNICLLLQELRTLAFGEIRREIKTPAADTTIPYLTPSVHPLWMEVFTLSGQSSSSSSTTSPAPAPSRHQQHSICEVKKKQLLSPFWCTKQGTFDVSSRTEGGGSSQLHQNLSMIMSGDRIVKQCIDADSRGRVAIADNKHVLIVDPTNFLMGPDGKGVGQMVYSSAGTLPVSSMADRSHLGTLCDTDVGFAIMGLTFNPENEQHIAVWGMSRVVVLTGQHEASVLGEPRSQLKVDLSFGMGEDSSTSILKAMWIPNSQVLLVVVCVQFVRVYDLSKDVTIPIHTLFLPATLSEEEGGSSTLICDAILLPTASYTSLHPSFVTGRTPTTLRGDARGDSSPLPPPSTAVSSSTTSGLAATVLVLTNHGQLFSKGICKPTHSIFEDGVELRWVMEAAAAASSSPRGPSSPKCNQDCEIRHEVVMPSHLHTYGTGGGSLYYSIPTGMVLYCTDSTFVLALAIAGAGDECEVVNGIPFNPMSVGQMGQEDGNSRSEDSNSSSDVSQLSANHHQQRLSRPSQYIRCVYVSPGNSFFNSNTSGGWNSWNTQASSATVGSWDMQEMNGVAAIDNRSTLLLCMASTKGINDTYGAALCLRANKGKGGGMEIATQILPWGSSHRVEMPSVNISSSGELLFSEPTFSSSGETRDRGGVQGMCVCPAFNGSNFATNGITGKGCSKPLQYPLSVLVLNKNGGLQCFRMANNCKQQQSAESLLRNDFPLQSAPCTHSSSDVVGDLRYTQKRTHDSPFVVEGDGENNPLEANSSDNTTSWPVDVFEHLHRVTTDPKLYLGGDLVGEYTPEQILAKLHSGVDDYVMMPRVCGGSVSLHFEHPCMKIAAVRVQVGTLSSEHRPQVLRVMGKVVPVIADCRRQWYDFILSHDEMMHCEHVGAVTVSVSGTKEPGSLPTITGIDVYAIGRPTPPSHIPAVMEAAGSPEMGSEEQAEPSTLVGVEAAGALALPVAAKCQYGNSKVDFVQLTLEACMEVTVEAVSILSARRSTVGGVSERRQRIAEEWRGNGNEEDGEEAAQSSSSSSSLLSVLENFALNTLSHTVLLSDVLRWTSVRKLCRSTIFYINRSSSCSEQSSSELRRAWENTTLGMVDAAQLEAIHGVLISPQLPMRQLRQCFRLCALVCRDRPDHRNPAIDAALCVSAFFRARWHCGGSASELSGVVRDLMRCVCLETECRRVDKDKRKGKVIVNGAGDHHNTCSPSFPPSVSVPEFSAIVEEIDHPDDEQQHTVLAEVVDQLMLLLCGSSAHLSCIAADQLVGVLTQPNGLSQMKGSSLARTSSRNKTMQQQQQYNIQKDDDHSKSNVEEFSVQERALAACNKLSSSCSDSDIASIANVNDVLATGDENVSDVDRLKDVVEAVRGGCGGDGGDGNQPEESSYLAEVLDGISTNSKAVNGDSGGTDNNGEGYQRLDYRCDGCNHFPLEGIRHHCTECADFDLCHACFARIHVLGTSPPPPDSDHSVLHRIFAQVIYSPPLSNDTELLATIIQGSNEDSDDMEVDVDDSVATFAQDVIALTTGNTNIEPSNQATAAETPPPMNLLPGREEESTLLEWKVLYPLSELLFPIFVDKVPELITARRARIFKHDNSSYLFLLAKLSERLPSTCTAKLIGMLEQELIRAASDLAKDVNVRNTESSSSSFTSSNSFCCDSDAFCVFAKTMRYLCSLGKGGGRRGGVSQTADHKVTAADGNAGDGSSISSSLPRLSVQQGQKTTTQGQQRLTTTTSMWNGERSKLLFNLCEFLRSILGNVDDAAGLGRVPSSVPRSTSIACYGRDGTPMSSSDYKLEMAPSSLSDSNNNSSEVELLIPISRYSVSCEDQLSSNSSMLGGPHTRGEPHQMAGSSSAHLSPSPASHKIGVVADSNNRRRGGSSSTSARWGINVPDFSSSCTTLSRKYSWSISILSCLLKLGYTLASISKLNVPRRACEWGKEWILQLCKIIGSSELKQLHRSAKGLLSKLCGSHTMYHRFRDQYLFATEVKQVINTLSPAVAQQQQQQHPSSGPLHHEKRCEDVRYSYQVASKMSLDVLLKAATARPSHWQRFCCLSKIPSLDDDSWPLEFLSSRQGGGGGQSAAAASSVLAIGDDMREGGKVPCKTTDSESGGKDPTQPPVCALLSLLWLPSIPFSIKVGILDLLEKAVASSLPPMTSTDETMAIQAADPVRGRGGHIPSKKPAVVQTSESSSLPALLLLTDGPNPPHVLLIRMAKELVLSCPCRGVRQRAANLVLYLWRTSPESSQGEFVRAMAKDMPESTYFGMRSREWLELMRNITSLLPVDKTKTKHQDVVEKLAHALYESLLFYKCAIINHPNSTIYKATEALLNTSDCYLDQLPCPNCPSFATMKEKRKSLSSDVQQPHQSSDAWTVTQQQVRGWEKNKESVAAIRCVGGEGGGGGHVQKGGGVELPVPMRSLDSIRATSRTSESAVIVKLAGFYCIEQLEVRVSGAHDRLVKTINVYHHSSTVASINELRLPDNAHKWQRCAILCLGPAENSAIVELPVPLQTRALMFEFASFHQQDVVVQSSKGGERGGRSRYKKAIGGGRNSGRRIGLETVLCPRCSCAVIDHHGVCQQCGEVAFQCKQCRHINYEHLDAFLCIECGYCAYGNYKWLVAAKPVLSLTHVSSDSGREDALEALVAADKKARGYQQSIMSIRVEVQQIVMSLGMVVGGSGSGGVAGTSLVPFYTEYEELVREMMKGPATTKDAATSAAAATAAMATTAGGATATTIMSSAVTPFLRSLFVSVFPDDWNLDGNLDNTVDPDRAGEDMVLDDDDDDIDNDDDDDNEAEGEGERDGDGDAPVHLSVGGDDDTDDHGGERAAVIGRGGVRSSGAKRTGSLIGDENRRGGGVCITADATDPCEATGALDHILSLSLSQGQHLGNRRGGGGEIGLSFEDCIHVARGRSRSSMGFVRAAHRRPLSTYRNPQGRVSNRNCRGGAAAAAGLAGSGRTESGGGGEKGGSSSAAAADLNQVTPHHTQNGSGINNATSSSQSSSPLQSAHVSDGVVPAVENLFELYCKAGRYEAIRLREVSEEISALRKALYHYQLRAPLQSWDRQRQQQRYLEIDHEEKKPPSFSTTTTALRKSSGGGITTCYSCIREVIIQLLLTLSSLYLRGYEGRGTMLEDLLMSQLNDGERMGSSSCKAASRQCVISILKGSPKRACGIVLKHLDERFNLAFKYFTGPNFHVCVGNDWLLFRDLLLGPKLLVGYKEQPQQQQQKQPREGSIGTETEESKTTGKGGPRRKTKGHLVPPATTTSSAASVEAKFLHSEVVSALSVPFLFSTQSMPPLDTSREGLISILFSIISRAMKGTSKMMITHVALPTLSILAKVCLVEQQNGEGDLYASHRLLQEALDASSDAALCCWKTSSSIGYTSKNSPLWVTILQARRYNLAQKYCLLWLQRVSWLGRPGKSSAFFNQYPTIASSPLPKHFIWSMLATPHSAQARTLSGLLLLRLAQGSAHHIDMLESAMHVFSVMPLEGAEEEALPCLALASALWQTTPLCTAYMAARGLVPAMCRLLLREADWLRKREVEWTYLHHPVGGGSPVSSQSLARSGDLLLRCSEALMTYCSFCSSYGFSWASPTPFKLSDVTSIRQVIVKVECLVLAKTVATTRVAVVLRRMIMQWEDPEIHVRASVRVLQQCASPFSPFSVEWDSAQQRDFPEFTLDISSIQKLLHEMTLFVSPPNENPPFPVLMRREPSHDVYFRGSLTCNPFLSSAVTPLQRKEEISSSPSQGGHCRDGSGRDGEVEATMDDLRHKIACELDMADAAELLELLVCNRIISPTIPLRLVFEKLWYPYTLENHDEYPSDCEAEDLVPMTVTYRLGGVDGEATEDKVDSLNDDTDEGIEAEMARRKVLTSAIGEEGGLTLLLGLLQLRPSAEKNVQGSLDASISSTDGCGGNSHEIHHRLVQDVVMQHPECHDIVARSLQLLRHCCDVEANKRKLLNIRAPGILLHCMVDVLHGTGGKQARQPTLNGLLSIIEALAQELTEENSLSCTAPSDDGGGQKENVQTATNTAVVAAAAAAGTTMELNTAFLSVAVLGLDSSHSSSSLHRQGPPPLQYDEQESMEVDEDVEGQHLHFLLDALKEKSMIQVLRDAPPLMRSVSRLLPFLTYAKPKAIQALTDQFGHVVMWEEDDEEESMTQPGQGQSDSITTQIRNDNDEGEAKAARDIRRKCFEEALDTMACNRAGDAIRSTLIDTGFLLNCCHFVLEGLPYPDAPWADWEPYCRRDKLTRALRVLTGLTRAHKPSQAVLFEAGLLSAMHRLERAPASISGEIGLLAETLLESMAENNPNIALELSKLREKERALKHAQASAQRDKALLAMHLSSGMGTTQDLSGGKVGGGMTDECSPSSSGKLPAWMEEMEELEEETGLSCMVCREGYSCSPREILGAYVHVRAVGVSNLSQLEGHSLILQPQQKQFVELLRRCTIQHMKQTTHRRLCERLMEETDIGEHMSGSLCSASSNSTGGVLHERKKQKESGSLLILSTSAFNVLHFSCHKKAEHADKNLRNPKSEWEGAALRNSRMQCNSMLPIRNPCSSTGNPMSRGGIGSVEVSWTQCLDVHFINIHEVMQSELYASGGSGHRIVPVLGRICLVLHDIRLLLMQLCYQEISSTRGGGSLGSNVQLFWYMLQLAGHVCKMGGEETAKYKMLLPSPEAQESLEGTTAASAETLALRAVSAPFRFVLSIVLDDRDTWATRKLTLASDMIRLVGMRRSRGLEGSGACVKPTRSMSIGQGEVGIKRKRSGTGGGDADEAAFNVERSHLETAKPAMTLLGLVNKVQSLWPGSADGLLKEDDHSLAALSDAMLQHLQHLTAMDISANNCDALIKDAGCEFLEDSSLSAKEWITQLLKEGESLATTNIDVT